jgi:hypothetical protein
MPCEIRLRGRHDPSHAVHGYYSTLPLLIEREGLSTLCEFVFCID